MFLYIIMEKPKSPWNLNNKQAENVANVERSEKILNNYFSEISSKVGEFIADNKATYLKIFIKSPLDRTLIVTVDSERQGKQLLEFAQAIADSINEQFISQNVSAVCKIEQDASTIQITLTEL